MPRIGGEEHFWMNGLYEACCILFLFPVIVSMGAGGKVTGKRSTAICKFLGDISYPVYMIHYPFMYLFYAWLWSEKLTFAQTWPVAVGIFMGNILLAYLCLKWYDEPLRKWLSKRFLQK